MRHWACGRTSCQSSLLPSWRPSWDSPPGKGLSPAAKTERTLTEDARPSKALSPSGDPLRPPARPPNRGCLSSPLWSGDAQHTEPSPAQQDGRAGGGGRGQPLARLLLRREHQRLASRDEQALCLEQLAGEHRFAGGRRGLAQDEPRAALRQGFGQEDRLPDLERLAAEGQGRGVSAEEGGVEEVAMLRDDLRLRPADPGREWEHAVAAAEAEDPARTDARRHVAEEEIEAGARKEIAVTEAGEDFDVRKAQRARVVGGGAHGEEVAVDEQGSRRGIGPRWGGPGRRSRSPGRASIAAGGRGGCGAGAACRRRRRASRRRRRGRRGGGTDPAHGL